MTKSALPNLGGQGTREPDRPLGNPAARSLVWAAVESRRSWPPERRGRRRPASERACRRSAPDDRGSGHASAALCSSAGKLCRSSHPRDQGCRPSRMQPTAGLMRLGDPLDRPRPRRWPTTSCSSATGTTTSRTNPGGSWSSTGSISACSDATARRSPVERFADRRRMELAVLRQASPLLCAWR